MRVDSAVVVVFVVGGGELFLCPQVVHVYDWGQLNDVRDVIERKMSLFTHLSFMYCYLADIKLLLITHVL
jgi:hypothetical protein